MLCVYAKIDVFLLSFGYLLSLDASYLRSLKLNNPFFLSSSLPKFSVEVEAVEDEDEKASLCSFRGSQN